MNFNPFNADFIANPYPVYEMLRQMGNVIFWEARRSHIILSQTGCASLLRSNSVVRQIPEGLSREDWGLVPLPPEAKPFLQIMQDSMLLNDPPRHTRLRGLVHKAFTPRMIEQLRQRIQAVTDDLLKDARGSGTFDLIGDLAAPLPVKIIATMLGIPVEDHSEFRTWSENIAYGTDLSPTTDMYRKASESSLLLYRYLDDLIEERRQKRQDDLLSALIEAEEQGDRLNHDELKATILVLLVAGHETTTNLIGNGMLALLSHRDQWELLKARPELLPSAIEELLRYDSPVQMAGRWVADDVDVHGQHLSRGANLIFVYGAANRDPDVFANPDQLDITRSPNPHLAFGQGIHYCLGAPLARLEGEIAIGTLARAFPNLQLVEDHPPYRPSFVFRGLQRFPVSTGRE